MAEYLVLIYGDEEAWAKGGQELYDLTMKEHMEFGEKHGPSIKGGQALQGTATATSIRSDDAGDFSVTDGAFAETKEALGGYYLIEAEDLDKAIEIAKAVPARFGGVEVRPVMVFD